MMLHGAAKRIRVKGKNKRDKCEDGLVSGRLEGRRRSTKVDNEEKVGGWVAGRLTECSALERQARWKAECSTPVE